MRSTAGTQTSNAWMVRIAWVLTGLTSANSILDSFGKFLAVAPLLEEVHRLEESESYAKGWCDVPGNCCLILAAEDV